MKKIIFVLCLLTVQVSYGQTEDCDNIKYIPQSSKPDFNTFLAGVKTAVIYAGDYYKWASKYRTIFNDSKEYLQSMGFERVEFRDLEEFDGNNCYEAAVFIDFEVNFNVYTNKTSINNIHMKFFYNNKDYLWEFSSSKVLYDQYSFGQVLREMYGYKKPTFSPNYAIQPTKRKTCWTETKYRNHVTSNGCDAIEGIYENAIGGGAKYRVALRKMNGSYHLIYLSGASKPCDWDEGEIKAYLEPTATPMLFKAKWIMSDKSENSNYYTTFERGSFTLLDTDGDKTLYIKMFPAATDNFGGSSNVAGSGTGFAISSNGYIVTNHHVIEGAKSIKVRGINGSFSKIYNAKVIIEDKNNDLAVIKIDDKDFTSLGAVPFVISSQVSDVATPIFVLGYPLRATMGDEVKFTNGTISSKSGWQGDITSYQITAPVQPGNSGGPLFDNKGNLIGIINAKHMGAENASYAVKSSYLLNLISMISPPLRLQAVSSVIGKPQTEQVKTLKKFVYIIEVN